MGCDIHMPCQHPDCSEPVVAEGRCEVHYREWLATCIIHLVNSHTALTEKVRVLRTACESIEARVGHLLSTVARDVGLIARAALEATK